MSTTFKDFIYSIVDIINTALPVLAALALLVFVWGLAKFIFRVGGDEKAVTDGKNLMIWGVIALFVMVSFIGLITMFQSDLGFDSGGIPLLPESAPQER